MRAMLSARDLVKRYTAPHVVRALDGVSLEIPRGQFAAVTGPSGSGKSTLLFALGGMLTPSTGRVLLDGQDLYALSSQERARVRARSVGFVFQMFHLVPYLTVVENVTLSAHPPDDAEQRARALIERLGLAPRALHRPGQLSAGEKQRTALGRALLHSPKVVLADEPTGNLDRDSEEMVLSALEEFHRSGGTVVLASHSDAAAARAERVVRLERGRVVEDSPSASRIHAAVP